MSDEIEDKDLKIIREIAEKLGEHFDSVQIFCTRYESDECGTISAKWGIGNWFSRIGQVREWIARHDEESRLEMRPDDDEL